MNDLAAMLGGGAAAPLPPEAGMPAPAADPMAALMGGAPPMGPPMPPAAPAAPAGFPSADPAFVGQMLEQLLMAQQGDQAALAQAQQMALMGNPLFEALMGGAPTEPGLGQDAQAIAPAGDILPPEGL